MTMLNDDSQPAAALERAEVSGNPTEGDAIGPRYTFEARQRVAALGQKGIIAFLEAIPRATREAAYAKLPKIPGFRPNPEFAEKQRRLAAHLASKPDAESRQAQREWSVFGQLWEKRGGSLLGMSFRQLAAVREALSSEPLPEAGKLFLEQLVAERGTNSPREDVELILDFGPFQDHPGARALLERFPSRSQIERERLINSLPIEVEALQRGLHDLRRELEAAQGTLRSIGGAVEEARDRTWLESFKEDVLQALARTRGLAESSLGEQASLKTELERISQGLTRVGAAEKESRALLAAELDQIKQKSDLLGRNASILAEDLQNARRVAEVATEGLALLQERLATRVSSPSVSWANGEAPLIPPPPARRLEPGFLANALYKASPARGSGFPPLLVLDAAIRARELPLLMGPFAREFAEAWLGVAGGMDPIVLLTDPTLLSLQELTPAGSRAGRAPLAGAFARAAAAPDRVVLVLLDDIDPAASAFWLPELARALRQPNRFAFPPNLLFLGVLEADPAQMALTPLRAGELFPLTFEDCKPTASAPSLPDRPGELPLDLVVPPLGSSWTNRVEAFGKAGKATCNEDDVRRLKNGFADYLKFAKAEGAKPSSDSFGSRLLAASNLLTRTQSEA